ncbi:MAG: hypothetical protein IPK83_24245 [Planctomycetes bacterium]|nr:hypothetical protein [Planctomycetota bacterium]
MSETTALRVEMSQESCCVCGIQFSIPDVYAKRRAKDQKTVYCPNGHKLEFTDYIVGDGRSVAGVINENRDLKATILKMTAELDQLQAKLQETEEKLNGKNPANSPARQKKSSNAAMKAARSIHQL